MRRHIGIGAGIGLAAAIGSGSGRAERGAMNIKDLWAHALMSMLTRGHPKHTGGPRVSKYTPHQGKRECARRVRQIAAGIIDSSQVVGR